MPNLEINNNNQATGFAIRGIFSTNDQAQADPAVAFHVDGVYLGRPNSAGAALYDIDHIEVLRGPQGTLYGRNSTAGAINVITNQPKYTNEFAGSAEVGNFGLYSFSGMANVTPADNTAFRIAFETRNHDPYGKTAYEDQDESSVRVEGLVEPTDRLRVLIAGDYDYRGGVGPGAYLLGVTGDPRQNPFAKSDGYNKNMNYGAHGDISYDLDFATLTILPAFHRYSLSSLYYTDVPLILNEADNETSTEVRLSSNGKDDKFRWLIGLFWDKEDQRSDKTIYNAVNAGPAGYFNLRQDYPTITSESKAAFGQVSYSLLDDLRVIGGLRYTEDQKTQNGFEQTLKGTIPLNTVPSIADQTWHALNYKAGLEYDVAAQSMLYATISTGYKAGGVYDGLAPNSYNPEKLKAYEIGSKNRLFNNRVQINADFFYYDYQNYQATQLGCIVSPTPSTPCATGRVTYNASSATVYGPELESQFAITAQDKLSVVASYVYSEFGTFILPASPFGGAPVVATGNPLPKSPRWTGTIAYEHRWDFANGATLTGEAKMHLASSQQLLFTDNSPITRQAGYEMTDLNLSYTTADERWTITGYVRNLEDQVVKSYAFAGSTNDFLGSYLPPRLYGLRVSAKF
ncbi:MAG: TonB-dependent receptor [Azospirillaceae bacterium]|nr:TonB-dependent receptor [Azospirillaceae bacterium]